MSYEKTKENTIYHNYLALLFNNLKKKKKKNISINIYRSLSIFLKNSLDNLFTMFGGNDFYLSDFLNDYAIGFFTK